VSAPGVTVERIRQINGDAEFCQEFFDDVELTDDDVIGDVDDGWTVAQTMLYFERGGAATHGPPKEVVGTGLAPDLVALARLAGRLDDPLVRDLIAQAHVDDVVRAALMARIGALMAADPARAANLASFGKLSSGVFDPRRANLALQIAGDAAVAWGPGGGGPAERAGIGLLESRFMAIAGGTNEMQRSSIGERVLGLPREPAFDTRKPFREVLRDARDWSGRVG
jgi:alkylation response protein AidB-like acyl-CoA dehydrogenase